MANLYTHYRNNAGVMLNIIRSAVDGYNIYFSLTPTGAYTKLNGAVLPNKPYVYGTEMSGQYDQIVYFVAFSSMAGSSAQLPVFFKLTTVTNNVESNIALSPVVPSSPYNYKGNPMQVGGVYTSGTPTIDDGDDSPLRLSQSGELLVKVESTSGSAGFSAVVSGAQIGTDETVSWSNGDAANTSKNIDFTIPTIKNTTYALTCYNPSTETDLTCNVYQKKADLDGVDRYAYATTVTFSKADTQVKLINVPFVSGDCRFTFSNDALVGPAGEFTIFVRLEAII